MNDRRKLFCCISKFSDEIVKPSVNDWVFLWYIISDDYQNCKMMKGWIRKSPSHSSNPIDFSNIFILIKRTIYDMQIHDLVERSSTFIHVFRAQSISQAGHFLLYEINQFSCNNGAMIESLRLKHYSQKWWLFVSHLNIRSFEKYVFFIYVV